MENPNGFTTGLGQPYGLPTYPQASRAVDFAGPDGQPHGLTTGPWTTLRVAHKTHSCATTFFSIFKNLTTDIEQVLNEKKPFILH
jgi:hypothetical protein